MGKISTYAIKSPPAPSDMLVGTDKLSSPPNQTKNFTVQELSNVITDDLQYVNTVIPFADAQKLFSAPYEVIPAPGAGKGIVIMDFFVGRLSYGGTAYDYPAIPLTIVEYIDGGGVSVFTYASETTTSLWNSSIAEGAYLNNSASYLVLPTLDNCKVQLKVESSGGVSADATQGNSDVTVIATYKIYG